MTGIERWGHDEDYAPTLPHRGAPADEVHEGAPARIRPEMDVKLAWERMDGEGGGSAPMQDAPDDGDLRFLHRRLARLHDEERRFGHWPP